LSGERNTNFMMLGRAREIIDDVRRALSGAESPAALIAQCEAALRNAFRVDHLRCFIQLRGLSLIDPEQTEIALDGAGARIEEGQVKYHGLVLPLPLVVSDESRLRAEPIVHQYLRERGLRSCLLVPIYVRGALTGWLELCSNEKPIYWTREAVQTLQAVAEALGYAIQQRIEVNERISQERGSLEAELAEIRSQYGRLVQYGNILMVRTNALLEIVAVSGDSQAMLGVSEEQLLHDAQIWNKCIRSHDRRALMRQIRSLKDEHSELHAEVRIKHQVGLDDRWIMIRALPLFDEHGSFIGWEGFGLDITDRHQAREEVVGQSKRIEALYEVSRALQVNLDPALVTLRGLRAVIRATNSDSGLVCLYDRDHDQLELVSSEGLSNNYVEEVSKILSGNSLVRLSITQREGLLINNVQDDSRAAVEIARREGLRSTIIMPLLVKDEVQGSLVLFCKKANRYSAKDFDLVSAAASQICLAVRQAESYLSEKRQVSTLGALYRLSHELSKLSTPKQIAEHAFPIIQGELACKRMWLGVLNEQGTHLLGQAGFGPGIRSRLVGLHLDLSEPFEALKEALNKKQAIVVKAGQEFDCGRLTRLVRRLKLGLFVLVPLVSLGQVVGVLIVEPAFPSSFLLQRKLSALSSMAAEIAAVILSRRFEAKISEAEKMRVAGLLASGVAHNFNNMLQAVMGQASLIEMQLPKGSPLLSSSRMIVDAANRGASLIKQLLSFSMPGPAIKAQISLARLVKDSADLYRSVLGPGIDLEIRLLDELAEVRADVSKMQHVVTNLLLNAKDALEGKQNAQVRVSASRVHLTAGEVDPDLVPGDYVRLDVQDNGQGMDAEKQSRCLEPFFTTKNVDSRTGIGFTGSGLGLSTAYSIIKSHEGAITVSSTPGEGSIFSLYMPVAAIAQQGADGHGAPNTVAVEPPLQKQALLCLSENDENASVESLLKTSGFKVVTLAEHGTLVASLGALSPHPQLVVLDLDSLSGDVNTMVGAVRSIAPETRLFCICNDLEKWSTVLGAHKLLYILERPLSVWALQVALRRAFPGINREVTSEGNEGRAVRDLPRLHLVEKRGPQLLGEVKR
jgi:PAS domain S-box-containing protein